MIDTTEIFQSYLVRISDQDHVVTRISCAMLCSGPALFSDAEKAELLEAINKQFALLNAELAQPAYPKGRWTI